MTIDNSADWWQLVDQNWDDLVALFKRYDLGQDTTGIERLRRRDAQFARRLIDARRHAPHRREVKKSESWRLLFCAEQWVLHRGTA